LHTLNLPILLLLGVSFYEVIELVASFPTSPSSSKTEYKCIFYCIFELRVLPVLHLGRFHSYPYLVFFLLTFLSFSLHKVVVLFLSFSKSPRLLKTEFGCKRYRIFHMSCFVVLQIWSEIRSCSGLRSGRVLAQEYRLELVWALLQAAPG
jgi:hypothetical protein